MARAPHKKVVDSAFRLFAGLTRQQQLFFGYVVVLVLLFVFFPFVRFSPLSGDVAGRNLGLLSGAFFKTALVTFGALFALVAWNASVRFKEFVHVTFGFKDADYVFNFGLLWILLTGLLAVGEGTSVSQLATGTISTTFWYGLATFLVFVGLLVNLYAMVKAARLLGNTSLMSVVRRKKQLAAQEEVSAGVQSLFVENEGAGADNAPAVVLDDETAAM